MEEIKIWLVVEICGSKPKMFTFLQKFEIFQIEGRVKKEINC